MATVQDHYNSLLGPIYSWMMGDFDEACSRNRQLFDDLKLQPTQTGIAIDLGCGHGLQSVPLAESGFKVYAFDTCKPLLNELRAWINSRSFSVEPIEADITEFLKHIPGSFDVAVCMGDTLTHLPNRDAVTNLIHNVGSALVSGGRFILSLRDYVSVELKGLNRFIPVKSDDHRIQTCFLEYEDDIVQVHDFVYTRRDGSWELDASSYPKLRLDINWVKSQLNSAGIKVEYSQVKRGMVTIAGVAG